MALRLRSPCRRPGGAARRSATNLSVVWQHRTWGSPPDPDYPWAAFIYGDRGTLKASVNKYEFFPTNAKKPTVSGTAEAGSSILVQKGNPKGIKGLDDLCGVTVSVQKGTTQDTGVLTPQVAKCQAAKKALSVLRFEKDTDALQQVKNGRAVADLEDFPVAAYNAQTSGAGKDFDVVAGQVGDIGAYGIAVPSNNAGLRDALQGALKAVIADGTYDKILANWNVAAGALNPAAINGTS